LSEDWRRALLTEKIYVADRGATWSSGSPQTATLASIIPVKNPIVGGGAGRSEVAVGTLREPHL